jgi:hypothetical protein
MNDLDDFFLSSNRELLATVNKLDNLIGDKHWLSVGIYKETLLKKMLRKVIPKKYSVDSGFVIAADQDGNIIRSAQTDILIWDSTNYSPVFRDDDFVIIPPESCKIMIEVKGVLNRRDIRGTINNFDKLIDFRKIPLMNSYNISKYLFAYKLKDIKFPDGLFSTIYSSYNECKNMLIDDRINTIQKGWPQDSSSWPLYHIDGIFILSEGIIVCSNRLFKDDKLKMLFQAFSKNANEESNIYTIFESEILSLLGNFSGGRHNYWYEDQPGLLSLRKQVRIEPSLPKSLMIIPKTDKKYFHKDISQENVFNM